jgi:hypothetical protein
VRAEGLSSSKSGGWIQHQCKPHLVRENGESKVTKAGIAPQVTQLQQVKPTSSDPHLGASRVLPDHRHRHGRDAPEAEAGGDSASAVTATGYAITL